MTSAYYYAEESLFHVLLVEWTPLKVVPASIAENSSRGRAKVLENQGGGPDCT